MKWWLLVLGVCLMAGSASAGWIADSVSFGSMGDLKAHGFVGGKPEVLTTRIGTVDEKIACTVSAGKAGSELRLSVRKTAGKPCAVRVREIYPPDAEGIRYTYDVYADGKLVHVRDYPGLMFGPISYFIYLDDPASVKSDKVVLRFVNRKEGTPFRLADLWVYTDLEAYCRAAGFSTPFYLAPLLGGDEDDAKLEEELRYLKTNLRPMANTDVKLGCADEHHYMNRDAAASKAHFERRLRLSRKYDMPFETIFVSWWSGTPMWHPDGKGGRFSDPEYQQICWSETDTYDDGPALKRLLGDKYDLRYGFTVPNRWSSTPWLTMNHPVLNAARHKVIGEHLGILAGVLRDPAFAGCEKYLLAVEMENEPRYWDLDCPDEKYPVKRERLWADFNPVTVATAAKDGVTLDPSDGLDFDERMWLHRNVARYQQETYDAHAKALKNLWTPFMNSAADALWHEVYSHAFPLPTFPMKEVSKYHPSLEWNRLTGCRTGVEDLSIPNTAYLDVAREWGRWAQVNFEENNGIGTEQHLRILRACYAYGARFYNFYNWQSINREGRWTAYVRQFCQDKPRAVVYREEADQSAILRSLTSHEFTVDVPSDWASFNEVDVFVDRPGEYTITVYSGSARERVMGFRRMYAAQKGLISFRIPNSIPTDEFRRPFVVIARNDGKPCGLVKNAGGQPVFTLYSNSRRERNQSLLISWRADAEALINQLRTARKPGLAQAEKLFRAGDYRRAYEEAVRIETGSRKSQT